MTATLTTTIRKPFRLASFVLGSALLLAGCAGTDFKRPEASKLEVGKSTAADVTAAMGPPSRTGEAMKNGEKLKRVSYSYANLGGTPLYQNVIPARGMSFTLHNDVLVAQHFNSSFKEDGTDFDESKVAQIQKGKSTRADVVALMGRPTGEAVYPVSRAKGERAVTYAYVQLRQQALGGRKLYAKTLTVSFDAHDVATDVDLQTSGEK